MDGGAGLRGGSRLRPGGAGHRAVTGGLTQRLTQTDPPSPSRTLFQQQPLPGPSAHPRRTWRTSKRAATAAIPEKLQRTGGKPWADPPHRGPWNAGQHGAPARTAGASEPEDHEDCPHPTVLWEAPQNRPHHAPHSLSKNGRRAQCRQSKDFCRRSPLSKCQGKTVGTR